jgi:hypothetical protein
MNMTKPKGAMAVMGLREEIRGMDCKTAVIK